MHLVGVPDTARREGTVRQIDLCRIYVGKR
jgi:hypothetical protein